MAFARIALFPNGTQAHHEAINEALGDAQTDAPGRLLLASGAVPEGWQIIQVWESREQLERWVQRNLGAAFAKVGSNGYPVPPRITDYELYDVLFTPAAVTR